MKNIKQVAWSVIVVGWIVSALFYFILSPTSANPDYICIKNVEYSCEITDEWTWENGVKTSYGKRTTQVAYYHRRTSCEAGYSQVRKGDSSWASGRFTADFSYKTENCSITEYDNIAPEWSVEQIDE